MQVLKRGLKITPFLFFVLALVSFSALAGTKEQNGITLFFPDSYFSCTPADTIETTGVPGGGYVSYQFSEFIDTIQVDLESGQMAGDLNAVFPYPTPLSEGAHDFAAFVKVFDNAGVQIATLTAQWKVTCEGTPPGNPAIDIEKATNGEDADTPTGPIILAGDPVIWTYVVTNTGDVPLTNVSVTDDQGVSVSCSQSTLAVGESMVCTAAGVAVTGQYSNIGETCGIDPAGVVVCDEDPSHYYGEEPPSGGGQGCTPGYWKQSQHFDSWVNYTPPGPDYETFFGVDASFEKDFLGALGQGGGGQKALGRHATAAILNANNPNVSYFYTQADVIALVQSAYASGDFEGAKNMLEYQNELGCPLN